MVQSLFINIENEISALIKKSASRIYIAVAWFTNQRLFDELNNALKRHIEVKVLILDDILNRNEFGLDFGILVNNGAEVRFSAPQNGTMHNKFCVIDDKVITGSYNWTYHANINDENIVVIDEPDITNNYCEHFKRLFNSYPPIKLPYECLKWTDIKEGDYSELGRNIYRDIIAKNDQNREIRKAKLNELSNAYKSGDKYRLINAASLPTEKKHYTLFDVLTTTPQQFELSFWSECKTKEHVETIHNGLVRKWIFLPKIITNDGVEGRFVPYLFTEIEIGLSMSIKNSQFVETLKNFVGDKTNSNDLYKLIPEKYICINNVNMFYFQFPTPMFNKNQSLVYLPAGNPRYVYGIEVMGIVECENWVNISKEQNEQYDPEKYVYAQQLDGSHLRKIEKARIAFINGWDPYKRGEKIMKEFFVKRL